MFSFTRKCSLLVLAAAVLLIPVIVFGAEPEKEKNPYARYIKDVEKWDEKIKETRDAKQKKKYEKSREKTRKSFDRAIERDKKEIERKIEALDKKLNNAKDEAAKTKIQTEMDKYKAQIDKIDAWARGDEPAPAAAEKAVDKAKGALNNSL